MGAEDAYDKLGAGVRRKGDTRADALKAAKAEQEIARKAGERISIKEAKERLVLIKDEQKHAKADGNPISEEIARSRVMVKNPPEDAIRGLKEWNPESGATHLKIEPRQSQPIDRPVSSSDIPYYADGGRSKSTSGPDQAGTFTVEQFGIIDGAPVSFYGVATMEPAPIV